jgi:competence protein ComEC
MENIKKYGPIWALTCLACAVALLWYAVFAISSRHGLELMVFDIGQGDAIFITASNGNQVLVDGGPTDAVLGKLGGAMPFWDRSIDVVVLTHPHADHLAGLIAVLRRYDVGMVLESGADYSTPEYREWRALLEQKRVPVITAHSGQVLRLAPQTELDVLAPIKSFAGMSPKNVHDAMVVMRLVHASSSALLTGDAEKSLEYDLLFSGVPLASDILKAGHHGSKTSTSEDFVRAVAPRYAVISVGRKNRYGHPYQQTLDTLEKLHISVLRTDQDGDVRFVSEGAGLRPAP